MSPRKGKRKTTSTAPAKRITRDDIESKMRELQGDVDTNIESARTIGLAAGIGVTIVLVLFAYVLGRRRGKQRQTILEIRRI
jgi:hypothetical protein